MLTLRPGVSPSNDAPGPKRSRSVGAWPGPLPEGESRRARGDGLGIRPVNQAAPAWAGAATRLPKGRQARPDLTRVKSGKETLQLHPLVPPQLLHFMQVPLRTSV